MGHREAKLVRCGAAGLRARARVCVRVRACACACVGGWRGQVDASFHKPSWDRCGPAVGSPSSALHIACCFALAPSLAAAPGLAAAPSLAAASPRPLRPVRTSAPRAHGRARTHRARCAITHSAGARPTRASLRRQRTHRKAKRETEAARTRRRAAGRGGAGVYMRVLPFVCARACVRAYICVRACARVRAGVHMRAGVRARVCREQFRTSDAVKAVSEKAGAELTADHLTVRPEPCGNHWPPPAPCRLCRGGSGRVWLSFAAADAGETPREEAADRQRGGRARCRCVPHGLFLRMRRTGVRVQDNERRGRRSSAPSFIRYPSLWFFMRLLAVF